MSSQSRGIADLPDVLDIFARLLISNGAREFGGNVPWKKATVDQQWRTLPHFIATICTLLGVNFHLPTCITIHSIIHIALRTPCRFEGSGKGHGWGLFCDLGMVKGSNSGQGWLNIS